MRGVALSKCKSARVLALVCHYTNLGHKRTSHIPIRVVLSSHLISRIHVRLLIPITEESISTALKMGYTMETKGSPAHGPSEPPPDTSQNRSGQGTTEMVSS